MKKLAFVFAAIVAVSFASCGNKTTGTECGADSTTCCGDTTACEGCDEEACCDTVACDSVVCDSVVAE